jgi:hypothetical protein
MSNDRAQIAALGQQPLKAGDYIAPEGDDPNTPGRTGHVQVVAHGTCSVWWYDGAGIFAGYQAGSLWEVMERCRRIPGPRPLAPRMPDPQSAPLPGTGDVWMELIEAETDDGLRAEYIARRAVGIERYNTVLQRGNGRDEPRDTREELLDAMVYAQAEGDLLTVDDLRTILIRRRAEGR